MSLEFPHENKKWSPPAAGAVVDSAFPRGRPISGAIFSPDGVYRYRLWRIWDRAKPVVLIIGLNPSTAGALHDDPTILSCARIAKFNSFGGLLMGNLFGLRLTYPEGIERHPNPIGLDNDAHLKAMAEQAKVVIGAWGNHGTHLERDKAVRKMFPNMLVLGLNKSGQPRHPLYVRASTRPCRLGSLR